MGRCLWNGYEVKSLNIIEAGFASSLPQFLNNNKQQEGFVHFNTGEK